MPDSASLPSQRSPQYAVDPLFPERWSPRAMTGARLDLETLNSLLEAARWSPSSGNSQPWVFVHALRGTPAFAAFQEVLSEGNRPWCARAGALVLLAARTRDEAKQRALPHAEFDCGSAWMALALQASLSGLVAHAMAGFDSEAAARTAELPPDLKPMVMIALGRRADKETLEEKYRPREFPSDRRPVDAFAFAGRYGETHPGVIPAEGIAGS